MQRIASYLDQWKIGTGLYYLIRLQIPLYINPFKDMLFAYPDYDAYVCSALPHFSTNDSFALYKARHIILVWLVIKHMPKNVRMWFNFHKSKHRYYNVKLLQYELFGMNLTRLSCQKRINFGKLYFQGLSCKKRINIERHMQPQGLAVTFSHRQAMWKYNCEPLCMQPCTQICLRTDRLLIRIMTMHTCAAQLRDISTNESSVGVYVRWEWGRLLNVYVQREVIIRFQCG
jgi:hypothetical protein